VTPPRVSQRIFLEKNGVLFVVARSFDCSVHVVISSDLGNTYLCLFRANIGFDCVILCVDSGGLIDFFRMRNY
jgi:hypothetical protein